MKIGSSRLHANPSPGCPLSAPLAVEKARQAKSVRNPQIDRPKNLPAVPWLGVSNVPYLHDERTLELLDFPRSRPQFSLFLEFILSNGWLGTEKPS